MTEKESLYSEKYGALLSMLNGEADFDTLARHPRYRKLQARVFRQQRQHLIHEYMQELATDLEFCCWNAGLDGQIDSRRLQALRDRWKAVVRQVRLWRLVDRIVPSPRPAPSPGPIRRFIRGLLPKISALEELLVEMDSLRAKDMDPPFIHPARQ